MRDASSGTKLCKCSDPFHHQLNAYALAAGAAGVSLLALAVPADAKIIYTPAHRVIKDGESYKLDFNHDGSTDLGIRNFHTSTCNTEGTCWPIQTLRTLSGSVVYNIYGAVAMKSGMKIGPSCAFAGGMQRMVAVLSGGAGGSWINVKNRYLGVKFKIKGKHHYGWARLNVQVQPPFTITATLTGYAYETVPNKAIIAGKTKGPDVITTTEPANLGQLAQGAAGIAAWRPRQ
jgi:hypothetical protein